VPSRAQLEQAAARAVCDAAFPWHGLEVVEPVADDELGGRGCREEGRDRARWMLAVRIDRDDSVGMVAHGVEAGAQRSSLSSLHGKTHEAGADPVRLRGDGSPDRFIRPVVDDDEPVDVAQHFLHERALGHLVMSRHDRPGIHVSIPCSPAPPVVRRRCPSA
jgi:hypothetical protein